MYKSVKHQLHGSMLAIAQVTTTLHVIHTNNITMKTLILGQIISIHITCIDIVAVYVFNNF